MIDLNNDDQLLLTIVATMKYTLGYKQYEIAKRLNLSPMTISRFLSKAEELGIIEINIKHPFRTDAGDEGRLVASFPIQRAIVVQSNEYEDPDDWMAKAGAYFVDTMLFSGSTVGIAGGRTLGRVFAHMRLPSLRGDSSIHAVQLMGGFSSPGSFNPITTMQDFVSRFGIEGMFFNLPIYAPSVETTAGFRTELERQSIETHWRHCDFTIAGVGGIGADSILLKESIIGPEEMEHLLSRGAVGDYLGRWFDIQGTIIDCELNQRVLSIPVEALKEIRCKILVAWGKNKAESITGVLRTGLIDTVIIDRATAESVLA
jgi:deoxyribonucleoside regulator